MMTTHNATAEEIQITDFQRSYIRWRIDTLKKPVTTLSRPLPMTLNNVRAPIEARATLRDQASGRTFDYVLSASCKTEQVWVPRDVWHQPNADMSMIAAHDECLIVKHWDKADKGVLRYPATLGTQPERQRDNPIDCFDQFSIDRATQRAIRLTHIDDILSALFANTPLVCQTEYAQAGYHIVLEYPVKIANFSERERYYQVDTGPILFPLLPPSATAQMIQTPLELCHHAFVAHNCADWAEFIVCLPTPLTDGILVHHYSHSVRIEGLSNHLFACM